MPEPTAPLAPDHPALQLARDVARCAGAAGGRAFLVGGAVRDRLRGQPGTDLDLEVFGVAPEALAVALESVGRVDPVGKSFGIFKVTRSGATVDVGLPRTERTTGPGHREFSIQADPHLDIATAASRRDLTINAILEDPLTGELLDPWNGRADLEAGVLRHVSHAFVEDPLRVLRVVQFAARFEFTIAKETAELCRTIDLSSLPLERVAVEVAKWLVAGRRPSLGLAALVATGADKIFPELALSGATNTECEHSRRGLRIDRLTTARECVPAVEDRLAFMLAGLAGPELEPERPARALFARMTNDLSCRQRALALLATWPRALALARDAATEDALLPAVRRLALAAPIALLCDLLAADASPGSPSASNAAASTAAGSTAVDSTAAGESARLRALARRAGVENGPPEPFLQGRDVLALGLAPGPAIGKWLERMFDEQLAGRVRSREEAGARLREWIDRDDPAGPDPAGSPR